MHRLVVGATPPDSLKQARIIAAAMAYLSLLSWVRAAVAGSLAVKEAQLTGSAWATFGALFGFGWLVAATAYLRLLHPKCVPLESRIAVKVALAVNLAASASLPLTSNDVYSYLAYGRLLISGRSPYRFAPIDLGPADPFGTLVDVHCYGWTSPYGPLASLTHGLAAATGSVVSGLLALKVLHVLGLWALLKVAGRWSDAGSSGTRGALTLLAMNPLIAWEGAGQMHNEGLMLAPLVAFLVGRDRFRSLSAAALGAAFAMKVVVAPLCGLWLLALWRRSAAAAGRALVTGGAVVVATALPFIAMGDGFADMVGRVGSWPSRASGSVEMALVATLEWVAPNLAFSGAAAWRAFALLMFTAVSGLAARRAWRRREVDIGAALTLAVAFGLVMHWAMPWYVVLLAAFLPARIGARGRLAIVASTVMTPWLYTPDTLEKTFGVVTVAVHLVPLAILASCLREGDDRTRPDRLQGCAYDG